MSQAGHEEGSSLSDQTLWMELEPTKEAAGGRVWVGLGLKKTLLQRMRLWTMLCSICLQPLRAVWAEGESERQSRLHMVPSWWLR